MSDGLPELALRPGFPYPGGLPTGYCTLSRLTDGRIHVDRADPRVLISAELVDQVMIGHLPHAVLDWTGPVQLGPVGALLKITGVNRQVIYRLTEWMPAVRGYIAEWPD